MNNLTSLSKAIVSSNSVFQHQIKEGKVAMTQLRKASEKVICQTDG